MINRKIFFDEYRNRIDPDRRLTQREVDALNIFLNMVDKHIAYFQMNQWAYVFATVFHETGATFEPLREAPRMSEEWRRRNLRYYPDYGRGYVQLTWPKNYEKYGRKLQIDLKNNRDLAMIPEVAFFILIDGFKLGEFTSRKVGGRWIPNKIEDFINKDRTDYVGARRCINGTDRAQLIANYAKTFEGILRKSVIR